MDAHLFTPPDRGPVDLMHVDATLRQLQRAARAAADVLTYVTEARDRLAAAPDDTEARHFMRMGTLHMQGEAFALAQIFATLAQPEWATP